MPENNELAILTALLKATGDSPEVQKAVVDYIKVQTAKVKAPEAWREIYRCVTDYQRDYVEDDSPITGRPQSTTPAYCIMVAFYSDEHRVAKIESYLSSQPEMFHTYWHPLPVYEDAKAIETYSAAIEWAQSQWAVVTKAFEDITIFHSELTDCQNETDMAHAH